MAKVSESYLNGSPHKMTKRGRPAKLISENELKSLKNLLESSRFLTLNQQRILSFIDQPLVQLNSQQLTQLKTALREKDKFEKRQELLKNIQSKHANQQRLNRNEIEILELSQQSQDRDIFFRLDRALQTYENLSKAIQDNKIRLEVEKTRESLRKKQQKLESQKKRNAENQLKYALGGLLLSVLKENHQSIDLLSLEPLREQLRAQLKFKSD